MTPTNTTTVTARRKFSIVDAPDLKPLDSTNDQSPEGPYQIETRDPERIPVPFNSPLSVSLHLLGWSLCSFYYLKRFQSVYQSTSTWEWAVYLCEVAFMLQELQGTIDMSVSLFGPRKATEHPQYVLKGTRAPMVHVLVTYSSPCTTHDTRILCTDDHKVSVEKTSKRS